MIAKFYWQGEAICQWMTSQELEGKSSSESQTRWLRLSLSKCHFWAVKPYVWANNLGLTLKTSDLKSSYWSNLTLLVGHQIFASHFPTEKKLILSLKKNSLLYRFFTCGNWCILLGKTGCHRPSESGGVCFVMYEFWWWLWMSARIRISLRTGAW